MLDVNFVGVNVPADIALVEAALREASYRIEA